MSGAGTVPARLVRQGGELRSRRIESLRAVAALGVVVAHAFGASYHWNVRYYTLDLAHRVLAAAGNGGVAVFFALSGYLLYRPFAERDFGAADRVDLWRYARNRALRILPLYWFAVALFAASGRWTGPHGDWWRFALFLENFSGRTIGSGDPPMWTLVVELQFYIVLPLVALALARVTRRSLPRAALVLAVLAGASVALRVVLEEHHAARPWQLSLFALFFLFALGMLLAMVRAAEAPPLRLLERRGAVEACVLAAVALYAIYAEHFTAPRAEVALTAASALAVGVCVLPSGGRSRLLRVLDLRGLAVLGTASYSLYLLHYPFVSWLGRRLVGAPSAGGFLEVLAIAVPASCAAALLAYAVVERPFLRLRVPWSRAREAV